MSGDPIQRRVTECSLDEKLLPGAKWGDLLKYVTEHQAAA